MGSGGVPLLDPDIRLTDDLLSDYAINWCHRAINWLELNYLFIYTIFYSYIKG